MSYNHIIPLTLTFLFFFSGCGPKTEKKPEEKPIEKPTIQIPETKAISIDTVAFQNKLHALANGDTTGLWPNNLRSYPVAGPVLPFKRIVAFYGNLYSRKMGILGEYPPKEMWERLNTEVKAWEKADPSTPVQPAIHYIAAVAQNIPMKDGQYCKRMPEFMIDS
ncbi:MAG: hypothetical protein GZ094_23305, partial [Mariniphaga sp.]|nr:hypothetical protein [Mariniphaga sp.]